MTEQLIDYAGADYCPVCTYLHAPFTSDRQAVAHLLTHSREDVAFSLLHYKASIAHALVAAEEPPGIASESEMDDVLRAVNETARLSPARPPSLDI